MLGADLSPFFQADHFAQAVAWKGVTGLGILDTPTDLMADGDVSSIEYLLTVPSEKFGGARYGDQITVGGTRYTVRVNKLADDGLLCLIVLTKV